jgi:aqualysin 1
MESYFKVLTFFVACTQATGFIITTNEGRRYNECQTILSSNYANGTIIYHCPESFTGRIHENDVAEANNVYNLTFSEVAASWGLDRIDQPSLPLNSRYSYGGFQGQGVNVYIVDSGILTTHPNFEGRALFLSNHVADGSKTDCSGHGTHIAGTIMSKTYGVAKKATAFAVRVFGCAGGSELSVMIAGINTAIAHAVASRKPSIINLSFGGDNSNAMNTAVKFATDRGIHVVASAGNDAKDACNVSPANAPSAITVMASDRNDVFASVSNYGACTDIIAPGVSILSTWLNNGVTTYSGTSMAAPHVSGVMAMLLSEKSYGIQEMAAKLKTLAVANKISTLKPNSPNLLLQAPPVPPPTIINCSGKHGDMYCDPQNPFVFVFCIMFRAVEMSVPLGTKCFQSSPTSITLVFA